RKTILFVSHDLDEALKLGDRIAVMEGGRIAQHGTPEEIVLAPANDYVRDFVAHVNPLAVFTAYNVMRDHRDLEDAGDNWV
ncbi:glycine betaine/L-proline ABC transporter ATP-binding protein, partial [Mycobacterium tuberculosis]|nr:glycine betaine/L-proline ABC transporter ATP-binding protein [Mycobacterium tuberculosis]